MAESAAHQARNFLNHYGVKALDFYSVACRPVPGLKSWKKLEDALILTFKHQYGAIPRGNTVGKRRKWRDELRYFTERRLRGVLAKYSR